MVEIISTLQIIGIPQDKHPEILEAFKEWKQTNAGTVDMFLEASLQLEPGTITKIKEQQVAQGPQDIMQTEDEMIIQPGSGDMQEIMQSVGAPQRAAQGGRNGYADGMMAEPRFSAEDKFRMDMTRNLIKKLGEQYPDATIDELYGMMKEQYGLERAAGIQGAAQGGRIGYQAGEQVLPMPRPTEEDPRAAFFRQMGAMPEQTLLRQPQSMNAMRGQMRGQGQGIMGANTGSFRRSSWEEKKAILVMGGQPLVEYEHEGAEQPPSWWDRMRTGTYDGSQDHSLDMQTIIDFLKKMGMAITKENIAEGCSSFRYGDEVWSNGSKHKLRDRRTKKSWWHQAKKLKKQKPKQIGCFRDGGITHAVPRQGFFLGSSS